MITITAFAWVPPFARGQVRDLRVRWALEEAGLAYKVRLLEPGEGDKPEYRALQPFGQVPIFVEDDVVLFETGAIVLHIGERSEVLLPKEAKARARARGDLMMSTVLRILRHTDIVTSDQRLAAYVERCTTRPAFRRALDAQLGDFREAA